MRKDDKDPVGRNGDTPAKPTRDARGRWLKGQCPNPKGRPRKKPQKDLDLADIRTFANMLIEVRANGQTKLMDRRTALLHKMFEDAMKGKVSMQKFLYQELQKNEELLAEFRVRYERLMIDWIIRNPRYKDPEYELPIEIRTELMALERVLRHYFPESYDDFLS